MFLFQIFFVEDKSRKTLTAYLTSYVLQHILMGTFLWHIAFTIFLCHFPCHLLIMIHLESLLPHFSSERFRSTKWTWHFLYHFENVLIDDFLHYALNLFLIALTEIKLELVCLDLDIETSYLALYGWCLVPLPRTLSPFSSCSFRDSIDVSRGVEKL